MSEEVKMQLVQRDELEEEPELFDTINKLISQGINAGDIRKLQDAGIDTYSSLLMHTKKNLTGIQGKSEAKVDIITQFVEKIVKIWDGIGESNNERDKMLLELEQECLDIYQRKAEYRRRHKAGLYLAALGNRTSVSLDEGSFSAAGEQKRKRTLVSEIPYVKKLQDAGIHTCNGLLMHTTKLGRTLGDGTFAKVKFARNLDNGEYVAIKILDKEKVLKHKMVGQGGNVKELGYEVVEVGGTRELEEKLWEVIRRKNIKTKDDKDEDHNEEEHKENEEVLFETQDDEEHKGNNEKDVIEVFVEVLEVDGHITHMAEVRVGSLSRQLCQQLHNFDQLKALVDPLAGGRIFSPIRSKMCYQTLTPQERYLDLPTEYHGIIEITDRILVKERPVELN